MEVLHWLHAEGCPIDWQQARAITQRAQIFVEQEEVLSWVEGKMREGGILPDAAPGSDEEDKGYEGEVEEEDEEGEEDVEEEEIDVVG